MAAAVVAIGLIGALVGSFLNVVVHRLPRGESIVRPRSHCPQCGTQLAWRDNVPVLSWLALRGRCRSCGAPIAARYPLLELLTAVGFAAAAVARGLDSDLVWALPFVAVLVAVAAIDLEHRIVPNRIVVPAAVFGLGVAVALRWDDLPELLGAGAGAFLFLLIAALARPGGMGMGDVKLAGVIPALLIAFLAGAGVGVAIMARGGLDKRKTGVPFAPFLALGGLVALLVGPDLIDLYSDHFL
jgi:leader peptidase (prepilin peptidase) / N-methyltransferase